MTSGGVVRTGAPTHDEAHTSPGDVCPNARTDTNIDTNIDIGIDMGIGIGAGSSNGRTGAGPRTAGCPERDADAREGDADARKEAVPDGYRISSPALTSSD
ncbi:hypothetical protein ACH4SK_09105 [Streptomyces inhibens]|uniref:hypothetical protein n=1 Tax=Streptomyces inhibens TaxID=2293571 RepID=UPI0037A92280